MRGSSIGVLILLASALARADWPMLAHDPTRSGATPSEIRPPFERKWYRLFPDESLMSGVQPVIADGKVFIGTMRGILHAIDAQTGKDVYVDHHRPTWFLAWNVELLWRNEAPFGFPNLPVDVLGAKALILQQRRDQLERYLDLPWFKGDEYQIQKLALMLSH